MDRVGAKREGVTVRLATKEIGLTVAASADKEITEERMRAGGALNGKKRCARLQARPSPAPLRQDGGASMSMLVYLLVKINRSSRQSVFKTTSCKPSCSHEIASDRQARLLFCDRYARKFRHHSAVRRSTIYSALIWFFANKRRSRSASSSVKTILSGDTSR